MANYAILTLFGKDQSGIVARVTEVLFKNGCNIEDSSMTRLRNEFTIMLILNLPAELSTRELTARLQPVAVPMELELHIRRLSETDMSVFPAQTDSAANLAKQPSNGCVVSVLGADKPGIVYRVSQILSNDKANIVDLYTQMLGTDKRPIYGMVIEAEEVDNIDALSNKLQVLAEELGVEISVRDPNVFQL